MNVLLPRSEFVECVSAYEYDDDPRIFVRSSWLENLHLRSYSVFGLIDAVGVKAALSAGMLTRGRLAVSVAVSVAAPVLLISDLC